MREVRKIFYILLILNLFLSISSCKLSKESTSSDSGSEEAISNDEKPKKPISIVARIGKFPESSPVIIDSVNIEDNTLHLKVHYTGGCVLHRFEFIGDPAIVKTNPPKRTVKLIHLHEIDICSDEINEQIDVDIRELSITETSGSEIILLIEGYPSPIHYIYP